MEPPHTQLSFHRRSLATLAQGMRAYLILLKTSFSYVQLT
jgi:hypothetical protein